MILPDAVVFGVNLPASRAALRLPFVEDRAARPLGSCRDHTQVPGAGAGVLTASAQKPSSHSRRFLDLEVGEDQLNGSYVEPQRR